jgi:ABC-type ATPase with predicted acetyltransferase domain
MAVNPGPWRSRSVIDDLPGDDDDVFRTLHRVGFGSIPSWLEPFSVLSTGEQMRVEIAWRLLGPDNTVVVDEFTSTVDRDIARFACVAIRKAIKASNKQFVAVSCHNDFIEWLAPDWILNTQTMQTEKKKTGKISGSNLKLDPVINQDGMSSVVITICRTRCPEDVAATVRGGKVE